MSQKPQTLAPIDWQRQFDKWLGGMGKKALARLSTGTEYLDLHWYLWCWTRPEFWKELRQSAENFRGEIERFGDLADELESMSSRIEHAVSFFRVPSDGLLGALTAQIPEGAEELKRLCAIHSDKRLQKARAMKTQYDFVDPLIDIVRNRVARVNKKRLEKPWTDDLAMLLNAAVKAHDWPTNEKPRDFTGDSIRRHLERHGRAIRPKVVVCA
jgi:hypothetical protein